MSYLVVVREEVTHVGTPGNIKNTVAVLALKMVMVPQIGELIPRRFPGKLNGTQNVFFYERF
jgi:hypothetical protein